MGELGTFIGAFTSLVFTMWMGFGQTASKQAQTYNTALWQQKFPTSISNCPDNWLNYTVPDAKPKLENFTHLELYEVSYMWFSAVACLWCVIVGAIISLIRPADHKQ